MVRKIEEYIYAFVLTKHVERQGVPSGSVVKNPPANAGDTEMRVQSLGQEDPMEEGMVNHSSILAWRNHMDRGAWLAVVHRVTEK